MDALDRFEWVREVPSVPKETARILPKHSSSVMKMPTTSTTAAAAAIYRLAIADRMYSSWSLRGWLSFVKFDIPVTVQPFGLATAGFEQEFPRVYTPAATVPAVIMLDDDDGTSTGRRPCAAGTVSRLLRNSTIGMPRPCFGPKMIRPLVLFAAVS